MPERRMPIIIFTLLLTSILMQMLLVKLSHTLNLHSIRLISEYLQLSGCLNV